MAFARGVLALTGFGITSLLWPALRRFEPHGPRTWAALAGLAMAAGWLWTILDRLVLVSVATVLGLAIPWYSFPRGIDLEYYFVALAWISGALVLRLWEREREVREALLEQQIRAREAQVRELAGRLHPHFLFNSLNTIRALAAEDPDRAREMLTRLATFLRHALAIDPAKPIPLAAEIESARAYLWIEEARFEPELEIAVEVDPAAEVLLVPPLILQPLIENALLHGEPAPDGIRRVRLNAQLREGRLRLDVASTGPLAADATERQGLGLTRTRLRQAFGSDARLTLDERDGWVVAQLEVDAPATAESGRRRA